MESCPPLSVEESHQLLHQLDLAMVTHEEWLNMLHRALVCGHDTLDHRFLAPDAYRRCSVGSWLYGPSTDRIRGMPLWKDIELLHREMHLAVRDLVAARMAMDEPKLTHRYDEFAGKRMAFKWMASTLEHHISHSILMTDPLTRSLTRGKLITTLDRELDRIRNTPLSSVIAMVDIDHFKRVNDTHGHVAGDVVLIELASFLRLSLRPTDLVFRYGGEEFLLCMPTMTASHAVHVLERLRSRLARYEISIHPGQAIRVTASFGAIALSPDHTALENIAAADAALYAAKGGGRNRVVIGSHHSADEVSGVVPEPGCAMPASNASTVSSASSKS
jgi:diguanylate cyclase